jgi:hypothetical protein
MKRCVAPMLFMTWVLAGCASSSPSDTAPRPMLAPVEAEFNVAPRELVDRIKQVLSAPDIGLSVASADKGVVMTSYQEHPGDFHIARRWQEHTRYRILVIPDWDNPTGKARVQITEETEQRATGSQPWQPAPGLYRQERSQRLLEQIQKAVSAR